MSDHMRVMPAGPHTEQQLSKAGEVYDAMCGYLLKRSGGKSSSMSPKGIGKSFSFGQLSCVLGFSLV